MNGNLNEEEAIHLAVRSGNVRVVAELLKSEICPNVQNSLGETPLHVACRASDKSSGLEPTDRLAILKLLWESGARINAKAGQRKETALHIAVKSQQVDVASFLLQGGANSNARDKDERTPLHLISVAATSPSACDSEAMVQLLVRHGANLHAQDARWRSPLVEAVCSGSAEVALLLLQAGAQIDHRNRLGLTALFYACETQNPLMTRLLLDHRASVNVYDQRKHSTPLHFVAGSGRYYTFADDAANRSHVIAKLLIEAGAEVDGVDFGGSTALHIAVDTKDERLAEVLLEAGAKVQTKDEYGNTALHVLLLTAQEDCCNETRLERMARLLVERGANVNEQNDNLETPFHFALFRGNPVIVSHLLANGASLATLWHVQKGSLRFLHESPACNAPELCGDGVEEAFAPLCVAAALGHTEVLDLLLEERGMDAEEGNFTGSHEATKTPLYFAVKNGRYEAAKALLDAGCRINRSVLHDTTVLHIAVSQGNVALAYLLLEYGANPDSKDVYGRSPLSCAVEHNRESLEKIAKVLTMHLAKRKLQLDAEAEVVRSRKWLDEFRSECESELSRMKGGILCDNFTVHGILSRSVGSLALCLGNERVAERFTREDVEGKYPIYCDMLRIRFDLAMERKELLDHATVALNGLFRGVVEGLGYETLPDMIVQKILDYCNLRDLSKIKESVK